MSICTFATEILLAVIFIESHMLVSVVREVYYVNESVLSIFEVKKLKYLEAKSYVFETC